MAWLNSGFTIDDAISRGFSTWDLLISDWGRIASLDPTSFSFPAVGQKGMPTVQGIAIGDQSEVDRCFVAYDIEKMIPGNITWDIAHRLSVGSPLMFPQPGSRSPVANGSPLNPLTGESNLVIYPTGTASIINNGGVSPTLFGATYLKKDGSSHAFPAINPLLHLVFYLKPPTVGAPSKRAPWSLIDSTTSGAIDGETLIAAIPTFGRKRVIIDYRAVGGVTDFRAALIHNCTNMATLGESTDFIELAIPDNSGRSYLIEPADADFTMVYFTHLSAGINARITVSTFD